MDPSRRCSTSVVNGSYSNESAGTRGRCPAFVEAADINDAPSGDRQHLPAVYFAAPFFGCGAAEDFQADEDLVAVSDDFRDPSTDPGFPSALIPGEHLATVLTART